MFRHRLSQFDKEVVTIHPGEYYLTAEDTIISTVLGSCVAVAIYDSEAGIGGLNHFMLPGELVRDELIRSPNAKYGMYAMELLINDLMKQGVQRGKMRAKVFGGGAVLRIKEGKTSIPRSNIDFAFEYLSKERIPVLASDVGGREPRKIFFFARTGKVLLKRIAGSLATLVEMEEENYLERISSKPPEGPVTMFVEDGD